MNVAILFRKQNNVKTVWHTFEWLKMSRGCCQNRTVNRNPNWTDRFPGNQLGCMQPCSQRASKFIAQSYSFTTFGTDLEYNIETPASTPALYKLACRKKWLMHWGKDVAATCIWTHLFCVPQHMQNHKATAWCYSVNLSIFFAIRDTQNDYLVCWLEEEWRIGKEDSLLIWISQDCSVI